MYHQPAAPADGPLLPLPPNFGRRIRSTSVAMGSGQLIAGLGFVVVGLGMAAALRSLGDPLWVMPASIGLVPALAVIALAFGLFRIRGSVSGDFLDQPRARRPRRGLFTCWLIMIIAIVAALLALVVRLVLAFDNPAETTTLSALDAGPFLLLLAVLAVGSVGFLIGRGVLPPPSRVLAKACGGRRAAGVADRPPGAKSISGARCRGRWRCRPACSSGSGSRRR